jgi:hypothetical protein
MSVPRQRNGFGRRRRDRVIPSRFHYRWKPVDDDDAAGIHYKAKCRWIIIVIP